MCVYFYSQNSPLEVNVLNGIFVPSEGFVVCLVFMIHTKFFQRINQKRKGISVSKETNTNTAPTNSPKEGVNRTSSITSLKSNEETKSGENIEIHNLQNSEKSLEILENQGGEQTIRVENDEEEFSSSADE